MKSIKSYLGLLIGFAVVALLAGCGAQKTAEAMDSDANGYQCVHCSSKFYTDRSVFAAQCPDCKKQDVFPVMGFVCPKDGAVMIASQTAGSAVCTSCKASVIDKKLPREADLKTWGAVKKSEKEVSP